MLAPTSCLIRKVRDTEACLEDTYSLGCPWRSPPHRASAVCYSQVSLRTESLEARSHSLSTRPCYPVLVMWRILIPDRWAAAPRALSKRYDMARKAGEAIVQSAAVYCVASMALVLTYTLSQNKGWIVCLNIFPPLIVSPRLTDMHLSLSS